jgi:hypothetical protein
MGVRYCWAVQLSMPVRLSGTCCWLAAAAHTAVGSTCSCCDLHAGHRLQKLVNAVVASDSLHVDQISLANPQQGGSSTCRLSGVTPPAAAWHGFQGLYIYATRIIMSTVMMAAPVLACHHSLDKMTLACQWQAGAGRTVATRTRRLASMNTLYTGHTLVLGGHYHTSPC